MKEVAGNLWDYHDQGHWVVITTNGTVRGDGECVMGRGVAAQAKARFPNLPRELGQRIRDQGNVPQSFSDYRLLTLPVKHNWWEKADPVLVKDMLIRLIGIAKLLSVSKHKELNNIFPLYMVRPGCGNGQLSWRDVKPFIEKYLDDRFIIVEVK